MLTEQGHPYRDLQCSREARIIDSDRGDAGHLAFTSGGLDRVARHDALNWQ